MNLNQVIKLSYSIPNGHKLRKACYSYMQYTNQVKRATDVDVALDAIKSLDQYTFSGQIIDEEIKTTLETLDNLNVVLKNFIDKIPQSLSQVHKISPSRGPEILEKVVNMSQQQGGEALITPEDISIISNSKLDPLDISKFNLKLDQVGLKEPLENKIQEIIDIKAPFLAILSKSFPWILGLLTVVLISYLYTKNKKVINKFILMILKRIRNIGEFLLKAIVKGYKWLIPIISDLVFVKSKEMWKKYAPKIQDYASKGLELGKEMWKKYAPSDKDLIDKAIWLKDKYQYSDSTANYLYLLRKDDREKQKILDNIKLSLRSKRTAKQNLIHTAFEIDYKLGNYLLKTI